MTEEKLLTFVQGRRAGELRRASGILSFRYDPAYDGPPLSLSMPVSNRTYPQKVVLPYLFGLLPDSETVRQGVAREYGVRPNNAFELLRHTGLDCPGAVQFFSPSLEENASARRETYVPLSDMEIAARLANLRAHEEDSWHGSRERWSLGGNQGKFALAWHGGRWCSCQGSAPTTHIFKFGIIGYRLQALNEFVCMRLARACGLPSADVSYKVFKGEPAIIVARYDRVLRANGNVLRLHQEDLCQALGVMPDKKYATDGGPTTADVVRLLANTSRASDNVTLFTRMLFFNYLIGATDAHAKNYSLLLGAGGDAVLAPLYDVASGLAYDELRRKGRAAMSVGGENRFGRVGPGALAQYAGMEGMAVAGLDARACVHEMTELARTIARHLPRVFDEAADIPDCQELRGRMEAPIRASCETTIRMLARA